MITRLLLAALLALAACARPQAPDAAYRAFAQAVRDGDVETAWSLLSERTRTWLDARAREAAARAPEGTVPSSGKALLLGNAAQAAPRVKSIVLLRESAERAVLQVEPAAGGAREVVLVQERGWRVDLPPPAAAAR